MRLKVVIFSLLRKGSVLGFCGACVEAVCITIFNRKVIYLRIMRVASEAAHERFCI